MENIERLEKFLMDERLIELEKLIPPNIFEVLQISNTEIRHSNMIAYLLNPNESHKLGDRFIKAFLQEIWHEYKPKTTWSFFDITNYDYSNCKIKREAVCVSQLGNRYLDIQIILPKNNNAKKDLVISIENKIDSGVNGNQLSEYNEYIIKKFNDCENLFLYLKPPYNNVGPDDANWLEISYDIVKNALAKVIENEQIPQNIRMLIKDYDLIIKEQILMGKNEDVKKICQEIYAKHKKAIDLITDNIDKFQPLVADIIKNRLEYHSQNSNGSTKIVYSSQKRIAYIDFTTEKLKEVFGDKTTIQFFITDSNLGIELEGNFRRKHPNVRVPQISAFKKTNQDFLNKLKGLILNGRIEEFAKGLEPYIDKYFNANGHIQIFEERLLEQYNNKTI